VTLGSELMEAWEGLGGSWITREGVKLEDIESERGGDDDDLGDGDPERLTPSLAVAVTRSPECRLPVGGFTNFEKKPGAICLSQPFHGVSRSSFIQTRRSRLNSLELQLWLVMPVMFDIVQSVVKMGELPVVFGSCCREMGREDSSN
jgi:hypothetical protein